MLFHPGFVMALPAKISQAIRPSLPVGTKSPVDQPALGHARPHDKMAVTLLVGRFKNLCGLVDRLLLQNKVMCEVGSGLSA